MKILVLGANGQIGSEIINYFHNSVHEITPFTRKECDLSIPNILAECLDELDIDLIINAAAYTLVDAAEDNELLAEAINTTSLKYLSQYCSARQIILLHLSTDYVFDGSKLTGYIETDSTNPLSVYGRTKRDGERHIIDLMNRYIILRVSWVFGKEGQNFVKTISKLACQQEQISVVQDQFGCPTAASDVARVIACIVSQISKNSFNEWGIYHYAGLGETTWYDFAKLIIQTAQQYDFNLKLNKIIPITTANYPAKATRPQNSVLITKKIERVFKIQRHSWEGYLTQIIQTLPRMKSYLDK